MRDPPIMDFKKLTTWLWRYLLTTTILAIATSLGVFFYSTSTSEPFIHTLFWAFLIEGLVLTGVGGMAGLSMVEFAYVRMGATNPPAMRVAMEHLRRGHDTTTGWGILLGLVGLTLVFAAFYISSQTSIL